MLAFVCRATPLSSVTLKVDNDFLYSPRNEDWNYTGGFSIEWSGPQVEELKLTTLTRLLDDVVFGWSGVLDKYPDEQHAVIVGGGSYTPHDITDEEPIPGDRPYASLAFIAGRIRRTDDCVEPTKGITTELSVGMLGLRVAEDAQRLLHKASVGRKREPRGWSHQISDGGEPTLEYRVSVDRLVLRAAKNEKSDWFQAAAGAEVAAGYNTYGWAGAQLKVGRMGKDYGAPGSIIEPLPGCSTDAGFRGTFLREWYCFARAGGYAVAYNALLQGQTQHSDVTFSASEVESFVGEIQYGIVVRVSRASLAYVLTRRSPEFEGEFAAAQYYGTVALTWALDF